MAEQSGQSQRSEITWAWGVGGRGCWGPNSSLPSSQAPRTDADVVSLAVAGETGCSPERLAVTIAVLEAHLLQLAAPVELVVPTVGLLAEVLHVHPDQHLPELHEVAVIFVLH